MKENEEKKQNVYITETEVIPRTISPTGKTFNVENAIIPSDFSTPYSQLPSNVAIETILVI